VTLDGGAHTFEILPTDVTIKREQRQVNVEEVVPSVIEPSFGIGRIMFAVFEHNFRTRDGDNELRQFIALPPLIAPIKCSVLPLSNKPELRAFVDSVCECASARTPTHAYRCKSCCGRRVLPHRG
jgi:glycyl-tRNA synthetase